MTVNSDLTNNYLLIFVEFSAILIAFIGLIIFILKKFIYNQILNQKLIQNANQTVEPKTSTASTQTENFESALIGLSTAQDNQNKEMRNACIQKLKDKQIEILDHFQDDEIIELVQSKHIPVYKLESYFTNPTRGVQIR